MLDYRGPGPTTWSDVPLRLAGPLYDTDGAMIELPYNSWGAAVAWVAGLRHVVREPDHPGNYVTTTTCTGPGGKPIEIRRPRSQEEQDELDRDIKIGTFDRGIPSWPPGYKWFLQLPAGTSEKEFWSAINVDVLAAAQTTHPSDDMPILAQTVSRLYQRLVGTQHGDDAEVTGDVTAPGRRHRA